MSQLVLTKDSEKEFSKLPKSEQKKVIKKLKSIESNPLSGKPLTGKLIGSYTIRAWPYRIIYEFKKKELIILVNKIQHRQNAYKH